MCIDQGFILIADEPTRTAWRDQHKPAEPAITFRNQWTKKNPASRGFDLDVDYFFASSFLASFLLSFASDFLSFFASDFSDLLSFFPSFAAGAFGFGWPLTVKPACDNLSEFLSPMPFTRYSKSAQSLKLPFFLRSSMIVFDRVGPMPMTPYRAACSALLASTCAKAKPIVMAKARIASNNFFSICLSIELSNGLRLYR